MAEVYRRKIALDKIIYPYFNCSDIILFKRHQQPKIKVPLIMKLEKSVKFSVRCDADIKFINSF